MCSGSTRPGKSTVPSGKTGRIAPTLRAYRHGRCTRAGGAAVILRRASPFPSHFSHIPGPACWTCGGVSSGEPPRLGPVLNRIDLRGSRRDPRGLLPRARLDVSAAVERIRPVVEAVREHGFDGIRDATERFDGVRISRLRVPAEAIAAAAD